MIPRHRRRQSRVQRPPVFTEPLESRTHLDALPVWVAPGSEAVWNGTTRTLSITGSAAIIGDTGSDDPVINAGEGTHLTFAPASGLAVRVSGLHLSGGAVATIASLGVGRSPTNHRVLVIEGGSTALSIDAYSTLDVVDNGFMYDYVSAGDNPAASIEALIARGYAGGDWTGSGITSSTAAWNANFALGVGDNTGLVVRYGDGTTYPQFAGQNVDSTCVVAKFTFRSDVNLDGEVNFSDAVIFNGHYAEADFANWMTGDMNYNGVFDFSDAVLFNGHYAETSPPPAPTNVTATPRPGQFNTVDLDWDNVTGSNIRYKVYAGTDPNFVPSQATLLASGLTNSAFVADTLNAWTTYYFKVTATKGTGANDPSGGKTSAASSANGGAGVTTAAAPQNVTATAVNDSQVDLDWDDVTGDGITYSVFRGTSPNFPIDDSTLLVSGLTKSNYTDDTASASTEYYYSIVADGPTGLSSTGSTSNGGDETTTPDPRPGVTTGLHVLDVDEESVTIVWEPTANATSYNLYRVSDDEEESETPYQTLTGTSFTDEDLPTAGAFRYAVAAVNPGGEGPRSIDVSATSTGPAAGELDTLFAGDGIVIDDYGFDEPMKVAAQPDGKLIVLDHAGLSPRVVKLVRYNPNGTLDTTFGSGGVAQSWETIFGDLDLAIQPDGKILLSGSRYYGNPSMTVMRFNADGSRDVSFGSNGTASMPSSTLESGYVTSAMALAPDGRIVTYSAVSQVSSGYYVSKIGRYLPNGQPDTSFGSAGVASINSPLRENFSAVVVQEDGRILLAGVCHFFDNDYASDSLVIRLNVDGSVDSDFANSGRYRYSFNPYTNGSTGAGVEGFGALTIQPDGGIVLAGYSGPSHPTLVRLTDTGNADPTFGVAGIANTPSSSFGPVAVRLQDNGRIVIIGNEVGHAKFHVSRFNADGSVDSDFAEQGRAEVDVSEGGSDRAMNGVVTPDGDIVVVGLSWHDSNPPGYPDVGLIRLQGDGLDLVIDGLAEEITRDWSTGEPEPAHETDPGAFIPLNDDFDEADPSDTDPDPDFETDAAIADDDELIHASLVFTGSHEHSGWMLDYDEESLRVFEQVRDSSGGLTLRAIEPNEPQAPPDIAAVNLRVERIAASSDVSISALLMPPDAAGSGSQTQPAVQRKPQDKAVLALGVTSVDWYVWSPDADPATAPSVQPTAEKPWVPNPAIEANFSGNNPKNRVRMFPDKLAPRDRQNNVERDTFHADRNKVLIKAKLSAPKAGVKIWFTVWDVDDIQAGIADPNDSVEIGLGMDNRRTDDPDIGDARPENLSAETDANGEAVVTFSVTKQPGNNYAVTAIVNPNNNNEVTQAMVDAKGKKKIPKGVAMSRELVVWRKLHIEQDSMAAPPATEIFDEVDPAPATQNGRLIDIPLARLKSEYAKAFIFLDDQELNAEWNTRRAAPWKRNTEHTLTVDGPGEPGRAVRDVLSEPDFWVIQVLTAYEGHLHGDNDGFNEVEVLLGQNARGEVIPDNNSPTGFSAHDGPAIVYSETMRDVAGNVIVTDAGPRQSVPLQQLQWRVALHETLHSFGMLHRDPPDRLNNPGDQGVMSDDLVNYNPNDKFMMLNGNQLDLVRSSTRPK